MDIRSDPNFVLENINRRLMRLEQMIERLLRVKKAETSAIVDELTYDPLPESNTRPAASTADKRHAPLLVHPQARVPSSSSIFQSVLDH